MTHGQHPIGTGFTAASTAQHVLGGLNLSGRTAIVTGGHAGIGLEVARAFAEAGAQVVVTSRDPDRAANHVEGMARTTIDRLDLLDPSSINAFADRYLDGGRPLDMLVNSAVSCGGPTHDRRGYERQFATNHLGHFQLTLALLPALQASRGARVVNVSSGAHRFGSMRWDDLHFTQGYDSLAAYAQSKVANILFAVELDRRWRDDGIRGFAVHPGVVASTTLSRAAGEDALRRMGLIDDAGGPIIDPASGRKTPAQAAGTIVFAAAHPLLEGHGGLYLLDNDIAPLVDGRDPDPHGVPAKASSHSLDPKAAQRLWEMSEALLADR